MAPPELEDGPVLSSPAPLACFIKCGPCLDPHVFPPCHQAHPKPALCLLGGPSLGPFSPASGSHGLACLLERPLGPPPRALRFSPPSRAVLSTRLPLSESQSSLCRSPGPRWGHCHPSQRNCGVPHHPSAPCLARAVACLPFLPVVLEPPSSPCTCFGGLPPTLSPRSASGSLPPESLP